MMFAWSRNFYAKKDGKYYCFEQKKDRDDAVKNEGYTICLSPEAYDNYPYKKVSIEEWMRKNE